MAKQNHIIARAGTSELINRKVPGGNGAHRKNILEVIDELAETVEKGTEITILCQTVGAEAFATYSHWVGTDKAYRTGSVPTCDV